MNTHSETFTPVVCYVIDDVLLKASHAIMSERCYLTFQKAEMVDADTEAVRAHWAETLFCWKIKNSQLVLGLSGI